MRYDDHYLSSRDIAIILAALRMWQEVYRFENVAEEFFDIATDEGRHTLPTHDEIDDLCLDLNCKKAVACDSLDRAEQLAEARNLREARVDLINRMGLLESESECLKGEIENITGKPEPSQKVIEASELAKRIGK